MDIKKQEQEYLKSSQLNEILDYEEFLKIIDIIDSKYKNISEDKIFLLLLKEAGNLIENIPKRDVIILKLINMFKLISLLFINKGEPELVYNLFGTYIKLAEAPNFETNLETLYSTAWDNFIIPISIKQPQLILIKFLDFWFGLGLTWNTIKSTIK